MAPVPGDSWSGKGRSGISQAEAERFEGFPLFWLGPSFSGLNLQAILPSKYQAPAGSPYRSMSEVIFIYGSCRLSKGPEPRCATPLSIHVQSACQLSPEQARVGAYPNPPTSVRGEALMLRGPGEGRGQATPIWTGQSLILITSVGIAANTDEIVQTIRGLGKNRIAAAEALPAQTSVRVAKAYRRPSPPHSGRSC